MPRPRTISDEQRQRFLAVVQLRQRIPTDRQLAQECGCSISAVRQTMTLMLAKLQLSVDTTAEKTATVLTDQSG